jgi:hypothetical protein
MSKKSTAKTQDDFESELKGTTVEESVFDGTALSIIKTTNREYLIVKVPLDIKNLKAGELEVIGKAATKAEAVEKFKLQVVRNNII